MHMCGCYWMILSSSCVFVLFCWLFQKPWGFTPLYRTTDASPGWIFVIRVLNEATVIKEVSEAMESDDPPDRVIAVSTKASVHKLRAAHITVFDEKELMYNAMRHSDSPSMRRVTDDERTALLRALDITDTNLIPAMLLTDVAARYHGFIASDIVKISRLTSSGPVTYYRIVR